MDGTAYEIFFWVAEFDFAVAQDGQGRHPGLTDVYWDVMRLPLLGTFRVGHMREPFSMESLTSGLALPFLERSSAFEAFCPFRNVGMMCMNSVLDDRATWALGLFRTNSKNNGNPSDFGDGEFALTGRVTALPWVDPETSCLLHLGAAFSHRGFIVDDDPVRFRNFCGIRTGSYIFADTGELPAEGTELANVEAALKLGPFVLQGEGYYSYVRDAVIDGATYNPSFYGWYVQATWLLTGEERPYRRSVPTTNPAVFDRPRPYENFFFVKSDDEGRWWERLALGRGAWEIGARYCYVDLNDPSQGVNAQTYHDITLGLNWYLTINTKMQFNYILAYRDFPSEDNQGAANIFAVRFHHDF
jgi:phosphate-selective porin OprO/OprP